jgi:hypothetical protein
MRRGVRFGSLYGKYLRIKEYPAYSATLDDIERDLDILERIDGFNFEVVGIDYADILADGAGKNERERLDSIWKKLKRLAASRDVLVITASQTNRSAITKTSISQIDTAEDIRKIAHVDAMIGLNQTPTEKENGIMRLNVIAHRHHVFHKNKQVIVEQDLGICDPCISSRWAERSDFQRLFNENNE